MQNQAVDPALVPVAVNEPEPAPVLSKTQQKKLLKKQRLTEYKAAKKAEEKARKAAGKGERYDHLEQRLAGMNEEEKEEYFRGVQAKKDERKRVTEEKRAKLKQSMEAGMRVVLDLDFADKMTATELVSVCQQISYSYSANTKVASPCHLHLTSLQGTMESNLRQRIIGLPNWFVTLTAAPYLEHFSEERSKLVYLTADSPNTIQEFDKDKIYIVGGLVDRNRHKSLCFNKAVAQGIQTARLPIGEHVSLGTSQVITINQVVQIIVEHVNCKDWPKVLAAVLPTRKVTDAAQEEAEGEVAVEDEEMEEEVVVGAGQEVQAPETKEEVQAQKKVEVQEGVKQEVQAQKKEEVQAQMPGEVQAPVNEEVQAQKKEEVQENVEEVQAQVNEEVQVQVEEEVQAEVQGDVQTQVNEEVHAQVKEEMQAQVQGEVQAQPRTGDDAQGLHAGGGSGVQEEEENNEPPSKKAKS